MTLALLILGLAAAATGTLAVSLRAGVRELASLAPVAPAPLERSLTVVVPARNEAGRIEETLDALLADDSPHLSVLVFDDRSTDDTAARAQARAARDPRVRLVRGEDEPPAGAFGKPAALAAATRALDEGQELVLFLDADVRLAPGALGGLVQAFARERAGAMSGLPRLTLVTLAERLLVPVLTTLLGGLYRPRAVHDDDAPTAFLNGQLILTTPAALAAAGGWEAVQDTVLEDVALARRLLAAGQRLRLADLRALASTRMYDGLGAVFDGFGKNALPLYGGRARVLAVATAALALAWTPWLAPALVWATSGSPALTAGAGGLLVVTLGLQASSRRALGVPVWPVLVGPLAYGLAFCVLARAALARRVTWRGRTYRV